MNSSNLYNKLSGDEQLITEDSSDQWDEKFEEVTCTLHYSHKFDNTNDVSTTYLGSYMAKDEPRTFPVDNHIPFDGIGIFPMGHLLNYSLTQEHLGVICQRNSMTLILC